MLILTAQTQMPFRLVFTAVKSELLGSIEHINALSDKSLLAMRKAIALEVQNDRGHIAAPDAFEALCLNFKSKASVADKRRAIHAWLVAEQAAIEAIEKQRIALVDTRIAAGEAGDERAEKPARAKREKRQAIAVVHDGQPPANVAPAKPAKAEKQPKPAPEPKAARDRYEGMTLAQLLAEVETMFPGTKTSITNESVLRYKLRRGEKQRAAGQRLQFSVSTPSAATVKIPLAMAEVVLKLVSHYASLHSIGELDAGAIATLADRVQAAKQNPTTTQQAA